MYEYEIRRIVKVVDGDTVDLELYLGFDVSYVHRFRLWGVNAPELKGDTLAKAQESKSYVDSWLNARVSNPGLFVGSTKFSGEKADKYGRWVADIYYIEGGTKHTLSDELVEKGYAIPFMDAGFYSQAPQNQ